MADSQYVSVSIWVVGSYGTQTRAAMAYYSSSAVPRIVMTEFYPSPPNYADVQVSTVNTSTVALAWTQCWNGAIYGGSDSAHTRWCMSPRQLAWKSLPTLDLDQAACTTFGLTS
ncbi:MAG: hypothetical protein ABSE58_06725 [Candidatus Limnocylindrales bacterium]